jgi:hypothetical protein
VRIGIATGPVIVGDQIGEGFQRAFVSPRNGSFLTRRWREVDSNHQFLVRRGRRIAGDRAACAIT